jgi:hypothetical protein
MRLAERGVHTLRIPASEVLRSVDDTLKTILEVSRPWKLNPPPPAGVVSARRDDGGGSPANPASSPSGPSDHLPR